MAELYLKREKESIWFPDNKFDQVNEIYKDFIEKGADALIELPNNTTTASQIVKIKRQSAKGGDKVSDPTEEDLEGFTRKIERFKIGDTLPHWQYMNFLANLNIISFRDRDGKLMKQITSSDHYGTLTFSLVEGNIKFYNWYEQLHEKYQYKYGRKKILAQKEKEHLSEKSGVVSEALKLKNNDEILVDDILEKL